MADPELGNADRPGVRSPTAAMTGESVSEPCDLCGFVHTPLGEIDRTPRGVARVGEILARRLEPALRLSPRVVHGS